MSKAKRWGVGLLTGVLGMSALTHEKPSNQEKPTAQIKQEDYSAPEENLRMPQIISSAEASEQPRVKGVNQLEPMTSELCLLHNENTEHVHACLDEVAEMVKEHRYGSEVQERRYFSIVEKKAAWNRIQTWIHETSEKTGVPKQILIGMGFIESQFLSRAARKDTKVFGAFQMKLEVARAAARDSKEVFGKQIIVNSGADLYATKTAIQLAALEMRRLHDIYGQWDLAAVAYAGGHGALEKKLKEVDPELNCGQNDWRDMERHHKTGTLARKERDKLLKKAKRGKMSPEDKKALRLAVLKHEQSARAYKEAKARWRSARDQLAEELWNRKLSAIALYDHAKAKGESVPHSITYALALDDIAERARIWGEKGERIVESEKE